MQLSHESSTLWLIWKLSYNKLISEYSIIFTFCFHPHSFDRKYLNMGVFPSGMLLILGMQNDVQMYTCICKLILESHVILYVFWLVKKVEVICQCTESKNRLRSQGVACHCHQAIVSLKVVSRKRRRNCTLKSYDRFTNS